MEIKLSKGTKAFLKSLSKYKHIYITENEIHLYINRDLGDFTELDRLKQYGVDFDCLEKNKVYLIKELLEDN